jgi:NitT/TauT family transport system substrate-binding protein
MSKFLIRSHGRLQEWVAEEKGYFKDEGLDYEFIVKQIATWSGHVQSTESAPIEMHAGAYESYEEGRGCNLSAACHWTVGMAASAGHGRMWAHAYAVSPSGIYVAPDSPIREPRDLANVEVAVGYHSGSHFSTLQGLEAFLPRDQIRLSFRGLLLDRLALLVDRQAKAANLFGAPVYVAEQLGFRKIVDTTFMIGFLITGEADNEDVKKNFAALRRAQRDIDLEPERYKHYFLRELPERYHGMVNVQGFGPGERIVFEPYTREIFERTRKWIESWNLFPPDQAGTAGYLASVV